jgi:hypothetical protein
VSYGTVHRAMQALRDRGLIRHYPRPWDVRRRLSQRRRLDDVLPDVRDLICRREGQQVWQSTMVNRGKRRDRRHLLHRARHPTQRDGAIAVALFLLPLPGILVLLRGHYHLDVGTRAAVIFGLAAVSIGLPTLWLTWAAYRGPRRADAAASGLSLAQLADQLAIAVGAQWNAEAAVRRLNDPYPLPVSWGPADASLTGAGWPPASAAGRWALGPDDLTGEGGQLVEVLGRVPTGRLVVLGKPGAGKTMLMVRLVLDLLARRDPCGPVPFLAAIAAWNPEKQGLRDWLAIQLLTDHTALASPPPADRAESTQAAALLAAGLILPILDGLDEIPEEARGSTISRINDALRPGQQLVVTSRTSEYQDAIRPEGGIEVTLRAAAAVQLHPLDVSAVSRYLSDDAAGPAARVRWQPVFAVLGTESPVGEALSAPLMVGLARAIYNPRPGELTGALRDPAELCCPALADRSAVESLLFDAFIPAAYRDNPIGRWKAQEAERWLVFLARYLEYTIASPDLAWWRLPRAVPGFIRALGVVDGVIAGILVGVLLGTGNTSEAPGGPITAAAVGAAAGLVVAAFVIVTVASRKPIPVRGIRRVPRSRGTVWVGVGSIALGGLGFVIGIVFGHNSSVVARVATAVVLAAALGVIWAIAVWLFNIEAVPQNLSSPASPSAALAADRRTGTVAGAAVAVVAGGVIGMMSATGGYGGTAATLTTVFSLATAGAITSFIMAAWPAYAIAQACLSMRHQLPRSLMAFLDDAHRRGVFRQAGAVYQFRHIELQHRLANRDSEE